MVVCGECFVKDMEFFSFWVMTLDDGCIDDYAITVDDM